MVRKVVIDITMTGQADLASLTWQLHPDDHHKTSGENMCLGVTETALLKLTNADGKERGFLPIFEEQLAEDYGTVTPWRRGHDRPS